jgi:NAD(P)-dependent dehydrogenase (short-subunit alcohol dehydrogenase family)
MPEGFVQRPAIAYKPAIDRAPSGTGRVLSAIDRFGRLDILVNNAGMSPAA